MGQEVSVIKQYMAYAKMLLHPKLEYSAEDAVNIRRIQEDLKWRLVCGKTKELIMLKNFPGILINPEDMIAVFVCDSKSRTFRRRYVYFSDDPYLPVIFDTGEIWEKSIRIRDGTALCYPLMDFVTVRNIVNKENHVRFGMSKELFLSILDDAENLRGIFSEGESL